jgi:hypothetical protein
MQKAIYLKQEKIMRANYVFTITVLLPLLLNAQVELGIDDFPVSEGTTVTKMRSHDLAPIELGSAGADIAWNFSALLAEEESIELYVNPADTELTENFPTATHCSAIYSEASIGYTYFLLDNSGMSMLGIGMWLIESEFGYAFEMESDGPYFQTPIEYGDSWSVNTTLSFVEGSVTHDSLYFEADAWGTVTDITGVHECLRLKVFDDHKTYEDGILIEHGIQWSYAWFSPGYGEVCNVYADDEFPDPDFEEGTFSRTIDVTTGIDELEIILPDRLTLHQAYPNPFNPITGFNVELLVDANLKICVYDLLGHEVARIADNHFPAGLHAITFDATGLCSGIYIVHATIPGDYSASMRVIFQK